MNNYIALEGVKGVGKSTVYQMLTEYLKSHNLVFEEVCPTRKQPDDNCLWERLYAQYKTDSIKERVYAHRSNLAAQKADWKAPLIVGDRSIATSYVTRLWKAENIEDTIKRVDTLEPLIQTPNIILYLTTDIEHILHRISKRKDRTYGKEDELPDKLLADLKAYEFLKQNRYPERLRNCQWIDIDCRLSPADVLEQCIAALKKHRILDK